MESKRGTVTRFDSSTATGLVNADGIGYAFSLASFDVKPFRLPHAGEPVETVFIHGVVLAVRAVPEKPPPPRLKFELGDPEQAARDAWVEEHLRDAHGGKWPETSIGGALTYCFTPTGLGNVVSVRCFCGAEKDLTHYDSW